MSVRGDDRRGARSQSQDAVIAAARCPKAMSRP
jgi:hypothetical protein